MVQNGLSIHVETIYCGRREKDQAHAFLREYYFQRPEF